VDNEQAVYDVLKELDIAFTRHKHLPVFTVEEAEKHWSDIWGSHCKNLFLRDKKGKHRPRNLETLKADGH
jgi:Ala-tRNA(Pro) deacylase